MTLIGFNKRMYRRLYDALRGDPTKLTLVTLLVVLASELPIYLSTALDLARIPALRAFRLTYARDLVGHLGPRGDPPASVLLRAAAVSHRNLFWAYLLPGALAIAAGARAGIYPYDTEREVSTARVVSEAVAICVVADFLFYGLHRLMHAKLYRYHRTHHEFRYSVALAHHWMSIGEAALFALPQALPPLLLWALVGRRPHLVSVWLALSFTQLSAIAGHAGWRGPVPRWLGILQPGYHDFHHVDGTKNFGAMFPVVDKIFGTYYEPKLENRWGRSRRVAYPRPSS